MIRIIVKHVLRDILRSRIVLAYTAFLLLVSIGLVNMSGDPAKGLVTIFSVVLMVVPLVSLMFATIHWYNSYEFIELLSSQPLRRSTILIGEYVGVAGALCTAFLAGVGLPVALYNGGTIGSLVVGAGLALTLVFVAVAFLCAVLTRDKARGIGVAILAWIFFAIVYDGIVLYVVYAFQDYPLEKATIGMMLLNPIDLARTIVLLRMDIAVLMGLTGAVIQEFLGTTTGTVFAGGALLLWIALPMTFAVRVFRHKDL